jgi:hypothetical protein
MGRREVATLAFRILGAYLVISGLVLIPGLLVWPSYSKALAGSNMPVSPALFLLGSLAPSAIDLIAGVLLWICSGRLASAVFPTDADDVPSDRGTIRDWLATAFIIFGFYLLAQGIAAELGALAAHHGYAMTPGGPAGELLGGRPFRTAAFRLDENLMEVILGGALVLFANKIVSFLYRPDAPSASVEE